MARDKDEIPNFDHLNLDGPEPAAPQPAAESGDTPPELPLEPQPAAEEPAIEFTFEEADAEPAPVAPIGSVDEPAIDFTLNEPQIEPAAAVPAESATMPVEEGDAVPAFTPDASGAEPEFPSETPADESTPPPGEGPPEAPAGEPASDFLGDFGAEHAPTDEAAAVAAAPEDIDFGISGEAGEEVHAAEEPAAEVSAEQLADAAAARKLNIAALALMGIGGLGVIAGFVLAFLKGITTWLAVLIGVHYAALPGLLLALGLFLFFALKKAGGTTTLDSIKRGRVYEAVLAVAFLALWIAGFCLLGELSTYGYDVKATTAPRSAPPSGV